MILADKIIDLRKKNGWSQEELAEKLGVSRQAVSKWESAQAIPDLGRVLAMADLFSVTTDYLLRDENEAPTPAAVEELVEAARSNAFSCIFLEGEDIYLNRMTPNTQEFLKDLNLPTPALADPARALGRDVYQGIAFLTPEEEHLLLDRAPHLTTTRWHPHFLDVIPSGGGKDKGVDAVLEHLGIDLAHTMAFGDGENDLSMLVHCGIGVAMGTASPAVQARADYVTGSVDEDGVVTALEHFGLL